jgi:glutamate/aspartate transport system substrate-binding protein
MNPILRFLILLPWLALWATPGLAQTGDTLGLIAATGTIRLGHRESSVPFSYYDRHRQVVGYSHDLMLRVVEAVRRELKLPALTVKLVPLTSQNRIALVQNGTVDLECGSTTHTREREKQVAFSVSIFVAQTRLLARRGGPIQDFADLANRRVVVTAGTTSDRLIRLFAQRRNLAIDVRTAREHSTAFQMLEAGEADAFMLDDALLYGERAKAQRPEDWVVLGTPMSSEYYACMLRRDDPAFRDLVNRTLTRLMQSGEAQQIHQRWFLRPIPPSGMNLNWPPSPALLALYRQPSDQPPD